VRPEYYSCARYSCIQWCFFGTALLGCVCVCSTVCMHTCVPAGEVCVMHLVLPATCYRQQSTTTSYDMHAQPWCICTKDSCFNA
jgi:hypothetical protein